ncbi:MAG: hypothetical protein Q4D16_15790 [Eubacteriales bacterium]|nr:hypothetical protein [Eubacteriales bacterium]
MKTSNRLKTMMTQFSYEHKKLDSHLVRVKKSADELSKLLDNMTPKEKKDEKK